MSYYDVDAILMDAQKVPCLFTKPGPHLSFLDPAAPPTNNDLAAGTRLPLPLWLAESLAIPSPAPEILDIDLPESMGEHVQRALLADPRMVELRALEVYYYAQAAHMLELFGDEKLIELLIRTFKIRASEIQDLAQNPLAAMGENSTFLRGMDEDEKKLFKQAQEETKAVRQFLLDRNAQR